MVADNRTIIGLRADFVSTNGLMGTTVSERRRKRAWPAELKREIVAASLAPGASVARVARRYEVNANQVFAWRKQYRGALLAPSDAGDVAMVPVTVTADPGIAETAAIERGAALIEIELVGGYRLRVGAQVDDGLLRRVLDVLERR
jgi:transposase